MMPKKPLPTPPLPQDKPTFRSLTPNNNNNSDSTNSTPPSKSIPPPPPPPDYPRRNTTLVRNTNRPLPPPPPPTTILSGPIVRKPAPIPVSRNKSAPILPPSISTKVEKLERRNMVESISTKNVLGNSQGGGTLRNFNTNNNANVNQLSRSVSHLNFKETSNNNNNNNNVPPRPKLNKTPLSASSSNLPILHRNTNMHIFSKNQTLESHSTPTSPPNFTKTGTLKPARPDRNSLPVNESNTMEVQPRVKTVPQTQQKGKGPRQFSAPELSVEELVDKIFEALKKFCNANKQIIVVSKSAETKIDSSSHPSKESGKANLLIGRDNLTGTNTNYDAKIKSGMKSSNKTIDIILENLQGIIDVASSAYFLMSILKTNTIEFGDESLFKQSLTSITTSRDSIQSLVDLLNFHSKLRSDPITAQLKNIVKNSDMALNMLIGSKAGKLITDCKRNELIAASKVVINSLSSILNSFITNNKSNLVTEVKVASCTISQLLATLNDTISSNLNLFSLPSIKMKITNQSNNLKLLFGDFMEILIELVSCKIQNSRNSSTSLLESFELIRNAVKEIVTDFCRYGEIDTTELAQGELPNLTPSEANINYAVIAVKVNEDNLTAVPNEITYSFDLPPDLVADVDPIWKEPTEDEGRVVMSESDANTVKCATLNKLIISLTNPTSQDMNMTKTFITTYRSFTTPGILLKKILQRYRVPKNISASDTQTIRARACNLLKLWIENEYQDFTEDLNPLLNEMFNELDTNELTAKISKNLRTFLEKCQSDNTNEIVNLTIEQKIPLCPSAMLFVFDEEELAKQLTIVDFQLFKAIRPVELINQAWSKQKLKHRAKNVTKFVARTTAVSYWVASVILWQDNLKGRIRAFTKIINIAEHLYKLNNFNALMAIIAGINMTPIYRLKHTKSGLSSQSLESIQMFTEIMEASQSYANYRQKLRSSNPPCVPFLGTYLTDITFIEDGNPDYLKGLINFRKRELEYNVIREIQQFQQIGYSFNIVDNIAHFLTELPTMTEDELFNLSSLYEPRNSSIEDIV